jgi:hypothetical protein
VPFDVEVSVPIPDGEGVVWIARLPPPIPAKPANPKLLDAPPNGSATRAPYAAPELAPVCVANPAPPLTSKRPEPGVQEAAAA